MKQRHLHQALDLASIRETEPDDTTRRKRCLGRQIVPQSFAVMEPDWRKWSECVVD